MGKGFQTALSKLLIPSGLILGLASLCFAESVEKLEEIVVTATRTEIEVERAPAVVNVVSKEKIELRSPKSIDEALNDLPGVFVRRGKGLMDTLSAITLRGVPEQKRTLVLIDGIPLNNPYTGNVKFGGFYPEDLERVEVVKGPFSSLYGGYAMGGVVQFITKLPEKREIVIKGGYGTSFDRGEGLDDLRKGYISYGDKLGDKLRIFLSYGIQATNGYPSDFNVQTTKPPQGIVGYKFTKTREGKVGYIIGDRGDNTWWDDGLTLKLQYDFSKDTKLGITFLRNRYEYDYDRPHSFLRNATTGQTVWSYPGVRENTFLPGGGGRTQNTYALNFEGNLFKKGKIKFSLSYLDTQKDWYVQTGSEATWAGCGANPAKCGYVSNTIQDALNSELQFDFPLLSNHLLTFGLSYRAGKADTKENYLRNWKDEDSKERLKYQSKGKDRTYALFVQDEIVLPRNVTLYLGLRYDEWKTYDGYVNDLNETSNLPKTGYPKKYPSNREGTLSPKIALLYKPTEKTTLKTSLGQSFRPPTIYELYRTWTSATSGITYAGNPALKPEKITAFDIAIEHKLWKGGKISLVYFENHFKDLIYRKKVTDKWQELVNVGKAESRGIEGEFEQRLRDNWRFFANFSYTDSEIQENKANKQIEGKRMTYLPLWKVNLGAELRFGPLSLWTVGRYTDKWFNNDDNSDKEKKVYGSYDSHFVVDTRVVYKPFKNAEIGLTINNLFDYKYYQYYKAPGRSWFTEFTIKF